MDSCPRFFAGDCSLDTLLRITTASGSGDAQTLLDQPPEAASNHLPGFTAGKNGLTPAARFPMAVPAPALLQEPACSSETAVVPCFRE